MSQAPAPVRIKSGPPWWVWVIVAGTTLSVIGGVILTAVPEDPHDLYTRAKAILDNPRSQKSEVEELMIKLKSRPDFEQHVNLLEGMLAYNEVRDLRALELFAKIPDGHELKSLALKKSGDAYRRTGQFEESMKAYQQAIDADSQSATEARISLAGMYTGIGAYSLAEKTLTAAIEQDPDNKAALETRAASRQLQAKYDEALDDFKQLLSTPGDFSAASPGLLSSYAQCLLKTGNKELMQALADDYLSLLESSDQKIAINLALERIDEVKASLQAAQSPEMPGEPPPAKRMADLEVAVREQDWDAAKRVAATLLLQHPRNKRCHELLAVFYQNTGQPERAAIAQQNVEALAELEAELQQHLTAISDNIDNAEGRLLVARNYMSLADYENARMWFSLAATMDDSYAQEAQDAILGKTFPRLPIVPYEADEKPADEKPADEKPADEKPADEKPADEKPADEPQ
ncbi:MAG: tetratricopeptide repeat protein [Planctomycetaceae bacterium]